MTIVKTSQTSYHAMHLQRCFFFCFKGEHIVITSKFCKDGQPMDPCFNRFRYNNFTLNFFETPTVMVGLESWDLINTAGSRLDIDVVDVTTKNATIRILSWSDSHSYSARTVLFACGYVY